MPGAQAEAQTTRVSQIRARQVIGLVFFLHGLLFASWVAHIPHVKAHLHMSNGTLGLVLLGTPVGSVGAMALGAWALPRVGSKRMVALCLTGYCVAGPFVGLASSPVELFVGLLVWGAFQGTLDVSMNTQAVAQESATGALIMSGVHGRWSLGALAGAGAGALGVWIGLSLTVQLIILGALGLCCVPLCRFLLGEDRRDVADEAPDRGLRWRQLPRAVLLLGAIAFASLLCEGAAADWSGVYLRDSLGQTAAVAGLGYAVFILAMVVVRLRADNFLTRYGTGRVISVLAGIGAAAFAVGLLSGNAIVALIGLAGLGAGLASVIPTVFGAAGKLPGISSGAGIALVSATGWAGYVFGPPLIGQLAAATSLPVALGLLPLLTAFIAVAARYIPAKQPAELLAEHR